MTTTPGPPAPRPKSNMAQIISAAVAVVALAGIYVQVHLTRVNAQRASARQVYLAYSQATLQYPRLDYARLKSDRDPTELVRYQIYVVNMLTAYDEIFQIIDDKNGSPRSRTTSRITCPISASRTLPDTTPPSR